MINMHFLNINASEGEERVKVECKHGKEWGLLLTQCIGKVAMEAGAEWLGIRLTQWRKRRKKQILVSSPSFYSVDVIHTV
jgi:hypothetical protein